MQAEVMTLNRAPAIRSPGRTSQGRRLVMTSLTNHALRSAMPRPQKPGGTSTFRAACLKEAANVEKKAYVSGTM